LRWLRFIAGGIVITTLSVVGFWFWLDSDSARQWLASEVAIRSNGELTILGLRGHPLSQLSIESAVFKQQDITVNIKQLSLEWSPIRLFYGELAITALHAKMVQIASISAANPPPQSVDMVLPFGLRIDALRIDTLVFEQDQATPVNISDIRLLAGEFSNRLAGELSAQLPDGVLKLKLAGAPARWDITGSLAHASFKQLDFSGDGAYLSAGSMQLDALLEGEELHLIGNWQKHPTEITAQGQLRGQTDAHIIEGTFNGGWQLHLLTDSLKTALHLQLALDSPSLLSRQIPVDIDLLRDDSGLSATLIEKGGSLKLSMRFDDTQLHADLLLKQWDSPVKHAPGQLSGKVTAAWNSETQTWQLQSAIEKAELAGVTAAMQLDSEGTAKHWNIRQVDVQALGLQLVASGQGDTEQFNMTGSIHGNNISPALRLSGAKEASGQVQGNINVQGTYTAPVIRLTAKAEHIRIDGMAIDSLLISAHHASGDGSYKLAATTLLIDGNKAFDTLKLSIGQKADRLTASLTSEGKLQAQATANIQLQGTGKAAITLHDVQLNIDKARFLQAAKLDISIDADTIRLAESPLRLMGGVGKIKFSFSPDLVDGGIDIDGVQLSPQQAWFRDMPYPTSGKVNVSLSISGSAQAPTAILSLTASALQIRHPIAEAADALILSDSQLEITLHDGFAHWKMHSQMPAEGLLESHGRMAVLFSLYPWQLSWPEPQPGSGSLALRFSQLSDVQPLLPRISPLAGSAELALNWNMPLTADSLTGHGVIRLDALGIPEFGLALKGSMQSRLSKGKPLIDLRLQGGDGELRMQGDVDMHNRIVPDIHFERFPLMQLPDYQLVVSGSIQASETGKISSLKGILDVVRMRMEIPESLPAATSDLQWPTDPMVQSRKRKAPLSKMDVMLRLSGDSEIYGRGMSLKPRGELRLGGSFSQPELTGIMQIASGKIEFRSVKLDILPDSTVTFSGDPKRPSIHIRAARKVGDILAGILVEGPQDQLVSRLFSEPAMSSGEIFSYIATGRPLASLGTDNASDVMTAAEFILGPGTLMQEVQGSIRKVTGLDILEIGGDASGGQIRAGKKLSRDLTVSVEQTVSREASTALTLEYMLTRSLSVFSKQTVRMSPRVGLRYGKEWFGFKDAPVGDIPAIHE